jgi:hypothetical protein
MPKRMLSPYERKDPNPKWGLGVNPEEMEDEE